MHSIPSVTRLAAALAVALLGSTSSFAREERVGQYGSFTILRVYDGNDSTRCVAATGSGQSTMRVSVSYDKQYAISVPGVRRNNKLLMYVEPPDGDDISFAAQSDGNRSWGSLNAAQFRNFLRIKDAIVVSVDGVTFSYPIGSTSLPELNRRLEQCNR
jgi:hypothetical protein